ncbi:MAG TPA: 2-oxoglutarate and iron-dependent oxygenase domain-containing protein [Alphaproteobacteria bacterium]
MTSTIPVIDLAPFFHGGDADKRRVARQIDEACTDIGFFTIVGHGVPEDQMRRVREVAVEFFALPLDEKMKVQRPPEKVSRGYNWVGDRSVSYSLGKAAPPDVQEAYAFGPDTPADPAVDGGFVAKMLAPNIWPERPKHFKEVMLGFHEAMGELASGVLRAMALALGIDEHFFVDKFDRPARVNRMIRYPAVTEPPLPGQLRSGEHSDYGAVTFVRGDDTPGGLQVKHRNGGWIEVHPAPGALVCNLGDLMMRWTNDHWVSTVHRVAIPPPDAVPQDRISLVSFQSPNPKAIISCIEKCAGSDGAEKYPPITCAEFYLGKLMKSAHSRIDATAADAVAKSA